MSSKRKAEELTSSPPAPTSTSAASATSTKRPAVASATQPNVPIIKQEPKDDDEEEKNVKQESTVKSEATLKAEEEEEAAELEYNPTSHLAGLKRDAAGHIICPYLDTINRHVLDFDFEKLCSVSLAHSNVYACLSCGKYFQGRGKKSIAYAHALDTELNHHCYINLATEEIFCLPDGYQIFDASLEDIQFNLHPKYKLSDLIKLDSNTSFIHALDGTDYLPGLIGLNNIKHTDWLNVMVQAFNFIPSFRNYFIVDQNWDRSIKAVPVHQTTTSSSSLSATAATTPIKSDLALTYSELLSKIWNPRSFKGHVSPHELLQSISALSGKKFTIGKFADCLQVMSWFLNELHRELGGTRKKPSIVTKTFQGEIKITTWTKEEEADEEEESKMMDVDGTSSTPTIEYRPFLYLSLALPSAPLFQNSADKAIIPQVPLFDLLKKFDGQTEEVIIDPKTKKEIRRTYTITKLPPYLIIHYQRFVQNNWFWEKNPTLVNFPLENLEMKPYTTGMIEKDVLTEDTIRKLSVSEMKKKLKEKSIKCENILEKDELVQLLLKAASTPTVTRYNLISNIVHDGKPSKELAGSYKCHTLHQASKTWYATEDLHVWTTETMAEQIALSEAYIQIYQLQQA